MAMSVKESENLARIDNIHANILHLVKKNCENQSSTFWASFSQLKEKETEGKIYSQVCRAG